MEVLGIVLQIIVIGFFILYSYSKIRGQSMKETFNEINEFIEKLKNE